MSDNEKIVPASSADGQENKKVGLPKPPLFTSDYITMAEILRFAMERFGQLILALMYYTADGTMPDDLPPDINMMFEIYQRKIDAAREKYQSQCITNAKNGQIGGLTKAANTAKKATNFKPPTQKQFRDAVAHFVDCDEIDEDTGDYDSDAFYDKLKGDGWTINKKPIQCRADWEAAIKAKFFEFNISSIRHLYYPVFSTVFGDFRHDKEENSGEWADNATYDFLDTYDEDSKCFIVHGENFPTAKWKEALAQFMKQYSKSSDT